MPVRVHFLSFGHVAVSYARAIVLGYDNPSPVPTFGFEPIPEGSRVASFSTACHPSYVRWRQAEVESLPELLDWATSQVRNAEAGIGKGLAGEQWESAKRMEAQLDQVRRASVADPFVQFDLGLNTAATEALITSFSTQITSDLMRALVRLGQAAREGFQITVGSYVGDNDTHSVRFSLVMGYYIIEDIKGRASWKSMWREIPTWLSHPSPRMRTQQRTSGMGGTGGQFRWTASRVKPLTWYSGTRHGRPFQTASNSEVVSKVASLRLIRAKRAEWLLQELGFDVAKALDELKAAPYVKNFDVWLRASWTSAHGYHAEATAINKDPATKANVFDV
ncbi:hypothetical protein CF327_g7259 [Tilletia walkeri]|nr:hypothetical protein CF327_g7259 [Tilletia walkeri]